MQYQNKIITEKQDNEEEKQRQIEELMVKNAELTTKLEESSKIEILIEKQLQEKQQEIKKLK